jgi:quercetin dioxygenase-like cupin family protein
MDAKMRSSAPALVHLPDVPGAGGVVWSATPGCNVNLVALDAGSGIRSHRNDEVDVLLVTLQGDATVWVDGDALPVRAGDALTLPLGTVRSVTAGEAGVRYLTVHAERRPLGIRTPGGRDG